MTDGRSYFHSGWEWDSCLSGEDDGGCEEVEAIEDESFYAGSDFADPSGRMKAPTEKMSEKENRSNSEDKLAASLGQCSDEATVNG